MKEETQLVPSENQAVIRPSDTLAAVLSLARDPNVNMDAVERLIALHERMTAKEAEKAFIAAKARIKAKLPVIKKSGEIYDKSGKLRSKYVKYEHLQDVLDPLMAEEGFTVDFDSDSKDGKLYNLFCKLSHKDGHSETKKLPLPLDAGAFRSDVQNVGSTLSYGQRRLVMMHFDIRQEGEDDDGQGGDKPISPEQALDLKAKIEEVKGNTAFLLELLDAKSVEQILARDYNKALILIENRRNQKR